MTKDQVKDQIAILIGRLSGPSPCLRIGLPWTEAETRMLRRAFQYVSVPDLRSTANALGRTKYAVFHRAVDLELVTAANMTDVMAAMSSVPVSDVLGVPYDSSGDRFNVPLATAAEAARITGAPVVELPAKLSPATVSEVSIGWNACLDAVHAALAKSGVQWSAQEVRPR